MIRRRQGAQTFTIAALAMTSMIGALSLVIDAGVYFVIQRQLQSAADAAALAAVWYSPACQSSSAWINAGCQTSPPPPVNGCADGPCSQANYEILANQSVALSLCAGPNLPAGSIPIQIDTHAGPPLVVPQISTYVVTLSCDAPHWFGRILPGVNLTTHISVSASAALGWLGANGELVGGAAQPPGNPPLVARLII